MDYKVAWPYVSDTDSNYGFGTYQNLPEGVPYLLEGISKEAEINRQREDTAYQRMVADMKAAGLNPWTGIASGGSASSPQSPSKDTLGGLINIVALNNQATSLKDKDNRWTGDLLAGLAKALIGIFK